MSEISVGISETVLEAKRSTRLASFWFKIVLIELISELMLFVKREIKYFWLMFLIIFE